MNEQELSNEEEIEEQSDVNSENIDNDLIVLRLKQEENFPLAVLAGLFAAILSAAVWAGFTVVTEYQLGIIAIGVGFLVAFFIRLAGKGLSIKFQLLGALLSFVGCAGGNFLTICYYIAQNEGLGFFEVFPLLDYSAMPEIMASTFSVMDIVFYGIAIYEGYRLSLRQVTEGEIIEYQRSVLAGKNA